MERKCQRCRRAATMTATNVNVSGQWYYCTPCMRERLTWERDNYRSIFQYVWPILGMTDATAAQRALFRDGSAPVA